MGDQEVEQVELRSPADVGHQLRGAIRVGVDRATQTLRGVTSAWVKEQEIEITNGQIGSYKVNLLITFVLL